MLIDCEKIREKWICFKNKQTKNEIRKKNEHRQDSNEKFPLFCECRTCDMPTDINGTAAATFEVFKVNPNSQ